MAPRPNVRLLVWLGLLGVVMGSGSAQAGEGPGVTGRVSMPDSCSPAISPAVVTLEPIADKAEGPTAAIEDSKSVRPVALINQQGLQFEPRVQVVRRGQTLRFTNQDGETHNVHILTPGFPFNKSMAPGVPVNFVPEKTGVIRLVCDIHSHMRGYVVVTDSPWSQVCRSGGEFRFRDVPDGDYRLTAWHEMGPSLTRDVTIQNGTADLGMITLEAAPVAAASASQANNIVRAWPEVIDRIGVLMAEARQLARKPEGLSRARRLAEDAYFTEFELSDMETAVRRYLGVRRAGEIEGQFRQFRLALRPVSEGKAPASTLIDKTRQLLLDLSHAAKDLQDLKISDRTGLVAAPTNAVASAGPAVTATDVASLQRALAKSLDEVRTMADDGQASEAASAMTDVYFQSFEPIESLLLTTRPQDVKPLEGRFNTLRGKIDGGLNGQLLSDEIHALRNEVAAALTRSGSVAVGSFGAAFGWSLVTILREGVEVILLLAMLIALVRKTGQAGAMAAIQWGVGLAVVASFLTAIGLNFLVASAQGQTREIIEGAVMLVAAGVLFSVSYWLISQTQAKKWADFLRSRTVGAAAGAGGLGTLCVTAFLAVYREGAETALMYQAMISAQAGSRVGYLGLVAGLMIGLVALGVIVIVVRRTSTKLPLRPFFQFTGYGLFAMAVVFAGNGVFELQNAGILKVTPLAGDDWSLPLLGIYSNVQTLSIQCLLLFGAVVAWVLPRFESRPPTPPTVSRTAAMSSARVGV